MARVMGSPPRACAAAMRWLYRPSSSLWATVACPQSHRATVPWEWVCKGEGWGGGRLTPLAGMDLGASSMAALSRPLPLVFGQEWIELLTLCAYRLHLSLGCVGWGGPCKLAKGTTEYGRKKYLLNLQGDSQSAPRLKSLLVPERGEGGGSSEEQVTHRSWRCRAAWLASSTVSGDHTHFPLSLPSICAALTLSCKATCCLPSHGTMS